MNDKNSEGYHDPTAHQGLRNVAKEEYEIDTKANKLVFLLKQTVDIAGFEFVGRFKLRHKRSGREFK